MLETEIQQGAPADVFAAASPKQTTALYTAGLAYKPVQFATNTLVMIVPKDNPAHIRTVYDITKPGVKIVGAMPRCRAATTRRRHGRTSAPRRPPKKNVVSEQTDVDQVVAQIAAGQGDVGFVQHHRRQGGERQGHGDIGLSAKAKPQTRDTILIVKAHEEPRGGPGVRRARALAGRARRISEGRWLRQAVNGVLA